MPRQERCNYILGLDIGANSVGWAAVRLENEEPAGIADSGTRVFDAGVEGNFQSGRGESRAAPRRRARLMRRQHDRRARRKKRLLHQLQEAGLLPEGEADEVLPKLDRQLAEKHVGSLPPDSDSRRRRAHTLPFYLRARALDERIEPYELGRAIYHLAQHRGFASNRRRPRRDDEDEGQVREAIGELARNIEEAGARTLGEYLAGLDPCEQRIRARWTSRQMHTDEFDAIWNAQASHDPDRLTPDLKGRLHDTIFFQRSLKSAKGLVGPCEFEPNSRRAPLALPLAQRFRLVQQVTNTSVIEPDGQHRYLTADERDALLDRLEREGDLGFKDAKKLLGISARCKFAFEEGGEKRFVGNRTNAQLADIFSERWWTFSDEDREQIIQDLRSIQKRDALERRGREVWRLDPDAAVRFAETELESDYARLSRRAMRKLLPYLEDGVPYATAVKEVYGEFHQQREPVESLPAVAQALPHLKNPAVHRALTELRKVVNAIVRKYGKPEVIRVELARDLRRSKSQRQESSRRNRRREKQRQDAARRLAEEAGIQNPRRSDIERVLLAEECGWQCPYTGRPISMGSMFGDSPQFDIEHIVPFSQCLDNSFLNKTLCEVAENRNRKRNRTPAEAYAGNAETWEAILERVKNFKGDNGLVREKLRRFQLIAEDLQDQADFVTQQMNDTRYASRQALQYLGLLYGGLWDAEGRRRVQAVRGTATGFLRGAWYLNHILGEDGKKTRSDHRHHAVDALVVALTNPATVKALADAAQRPREGGGHLFERIEDPWPGFFDQAVEAIEAINVSHRPKRQVGGPLHAEKLYSPEKQDAKGNRWVHIREPLQSLTTKQIEGDAIVDPTVRELVRDKLRALGTTPKKAFGAPKNHPAITTRDGRSIPIHSVRIRKAAETVTVGDGPSARHVMPSGNHHLEIFEVEGKKGRKKWIGRMVTRLDALQRLRRHEPVVNRTHPEGQFVFSLAPGDTIELDADDGGRQLYSIRSVSKQRNGATRVEYVDVKDARQKADIRTAGDWQSPALDTLRKRNAQKVTVTPLGEIRWAND